MTCNAQHDEHNQVRRRNRHSARHLDSVSERRRRRIHYRLFAQPRTALYGPTNLRKVRTDNEGLGGNRPETSSPASRECRTRTPHVQWRRGERSRRKIFYKSARSVGHYAPGSTRKPAAQNRNGKGTKSDSEHRSRKNQQHQRQVHHYNRLGRGQKTRNQQANRTVDARRSEGKFRCRVRKRFCLQIRNRSQSRKRRSLRRRRTCPIGSNTGPNLPSARAISVSTAPTPSGTGRARSTRPKFWSKTAGSSLSRRAGTTCMNGKLFESP